jgi:hypothetical protein
MHTFKKLPKISPNRKNAAARKYTFPARSKVFRARSADEDAGEIIRKRGKLMISREVICDG